MIEPQNVNDQNSSLMTQVADRILGNWGSWDASTLCGTAVGEEDDERRFFPGGTPPTPQQQGQPEEMAVEWEGQEVQLMEKDTKDAQRMPPPGPTQKPQPSAWSSGQSLGMSSIGMGSCHSWLPEQIGSVSSYFRGEDAGMYDEPTVGGHSMQHSMQQSVQQQSVHSIGGASLTRVFEDSPASPNMSQRALSTMPSWERAVRSKSPVEDMGDDESLISKALSFNSKMSDNLSLSQVASVASGEMVWESKE